MRRLGKGLISGCYFLLAFAQIPLLAGHFLLEDSLPAMLIQAALLPVSFLLYLLPGKIGGKRKQEENIVRRSSGGDPDPDRALRNEALPLPERRAFPLRAAACWLMTLAVGAAIFFLPAESISSVRWVERLIFAAIMAAMLPLALRTITVSQKDSLNSAAGIIAYMLAGVVAFAVKVPLLDRRLALCGLGFVLVMAFSLNNESMTRSASYKIGVRPPARLRTRNRLILCIMAVIGGVVLYFDRIRVATMAAAGWIMGKIGAFINWLMNLVPLPTNPAGGKPQGSSEEMSMMDTFGGETGAFWAYTEKIIMAVSLVIAAAGVLWMLWKIGKLIVMLIRRLAAHMKKFSDSVGEEYQDEQESLFDWDETRKELSDTLRQRLSRLMKREMKWEQMDARQRVRFIVRSLYRKASGGAGLSSLTVHEALSSIRTGQASPEELGEVYDRARYSMADIDNDTAERLRKEAKV